MQTLLQRLEAQFELAGANAGHEFRADPFRRHIANLLGRDEYLDALARAADSGELLWLEAVSIHPHALPSVASPSPAGLHIAWLLDENRVVSGDEAPSDLFAANPTSRHRRILHAVYRSASRSGRV